MSNQVPTSFVKQYGANVFHLAQQKGSRLRNLVRNESVTGDSRFFDRIGKAVAQLRTTRHADTPVMNTPHTRRMVIMKDYEYGDLVDDADKLKTLNDPTNDYSVAAQWALGRAMDLELVTNAVGNAYGGVSGATPVALTATQKIVSVNGSNAGTKLNVDALRGAMRILDGNDVDPSIQRNFAYNALQKEALLSETEVTSSDYNTIKALVMGQINTFMGFNFVMLELIPDQSGTLSFEYATGAVGSGSGDADGYDVSVAWAKDGLLLALGADIKAQIAPDPGKSFSTRVYASMSIGATRMEEEKVVGILTN